MFSRLERIIIALVFALLAAGITLVIAQAQESTLPAPQAAPDCALCHQQFHATWESGLHGQAASDPKFQQEWANQGKPGACLVCHVTGYDPATASWRADGVTCEACHSPVAAEHPNSPMPVDRTSNLCGQCHSDTRFGWEEWQGSTHFQRGMDCVVCHDPHSAAVKTIKSEDGSLQYEDASQLCITCHQEASMNFPYSSHHKQGISCVQCHVEHMEKRDAHTVPDHSFQASLDTCNSCHAEQMHGPTEAAISTDTGAQTSVTETPADQDAPVTTAPQPVSPLGFAGLAGLVGLAAGMVLAPWLERFYRRVVEARQHSHKDEDEEEK